MLWRKQEPSAQSVAARDCALWALTEAGRSHTPLEGFDLRTGHRTGRVDVSGLGDALALKPRAIWVASVIAPPSQPAGGSDVIRLDPRTRRRTLLVHVD